MISMDQLGIKLQNGFSLKDKGTIVVICRSGNRSATVTNYLVKKLGIDAVNLTGGVRAWHQIGGSFEPI
jgi:rhodanese-related sulfurtransferase